MSVSVNYVRPMSPQTPPPPPPRPSVDSIVAGVGGGALRDPLGLGGYFNRISEGLSRATADMAPAQPELTTAQKLAQAAAFQASGRADQDRSYANRATQQAAIDDMARRAAEFDARYSAGGGGGGGGRPDFSAYREALTGQAGELNARIQAMYNQLAEQAGANVGRIQDIYGGAQTGVGDIYDSATGNIQQAYSSSQQQAADQLARLGIEAAAPAVLDPMALAQAQAVSGLEAGRAGGLSALERYGSAASGFGSQMGQVAQQQGTEMNAAILASLQNRLADSLAAEQAGGGGGGGRSMSVSDMLKLDEARERYITGAPTEDQIKRMMGQERWGYEQNFALNQAIGKLAQDFLPKNRDATEEQVQDALALARSILTQ
jgi:hypothetical protein